MPKISVQDPATRRIVWVDATEEEHAAWKAKRAANSARKRTTPRSHHASVRPTVTSEPLEDGGPHPVEPEGPKRKSGPNTKPESILAPALPRLAQALAQLTYKASHTVTGGRAPMTAQEAGFVAIPAVRILDRTAGKYVKSTGVVTPNQEDTAVIVVTVAMWLLGWLIAVLSGKPRTANSPQVTNVSNIPPQAVNDLFSGSEPAGPAVARNAAPVAQQFPAADSAVDDGDLFSGSEPLAPDAQPVVAAPGPRTDPKAAAISEAVWAAISPTDRGEVLAG